MELENLYVQLQEIGLPAELQSLQNPTEEFMVYFITEYLKKFNFDGNEISKVYNSVKNNKLVNNFSNTFVLVNRRTTRMSFMPRFSFRSYKNYQFILSIVFYL